MSLISLFLLYFFFYFILLLLLNLLDFLLDFLFLDDLLDFLLGMHIYYTRSYMYLLVKRAFLRLFFFGGISPLMSL